MKKIIVIIFLTIGFKGYSQISKIIYIIPDSVEIAVEGQITQLKMDTANTVVFFLLGKDNEGIYSLSLFHDMKKEREGLARSLSKLTNRVLIIHENRYPLVFDYDFAFGTNQDNQIGTFGNREGSIVRSTVLFHGYTIYFNKSGRIIKTSNY